MQGAHLFERHAKTVIDLESFVEQDHLLRKIDRVLDTAFVRDSTAACYADGLGRPSVDPEVYFRMHWWPTSTASLRNGNSAKTSTTISLTVGSAVWR